MYSEEFCKVKIDYKKLPFCEIFGLGIPELLCFSTIKQARCKEASTKQNVLTI